MQVKFRVIPEGNEPAVVIEVPAVTEQAEELAAYIRAWTPSLLTLWNGDAALRVPPADILRFYAEDKGVSAQTADGIFTVRQRLYELEQQLDPRTFVRISHSEIVNLRQVTALDLSLSGTIKMTLSGGAAVSYASRRYVKKLKQALNL